MFWYLREDGDASRYYLSREGKRRVKRKGKRCQKN